MNICPVCEESVCGEIRVFNYDWFILTEYISIPLIVFTNCKEAINHTNESEPMSANTLVFIRTWGRGDCEAKVPWKLGSFHSREQSESLITNQFHEESRWVIHHRSICTWTSNHHKAPTTSCFLNLYNLCQTLIHLPFKCTSTLNNELVVCN